MQGSRNKSIFIISIDRKKATFIYQMMTQTLRTSILRKIKLHTTSLYVSIGVVTCVQLFSSAFVTAIYFIASFYSM